MQSRYSGGDALCKMKITSTSVNVEGKLSFYPKDLTIIDVDVCLPIAFRLLEEVSE